MFPDSRDPRVLCNPVGADILCHFISQDVGSSIQTPPFNPRIGSWGINCRASRIVEIESVDEGLDKGSVEVASRTRQNVKYSLNIRLVDKKHTRPKFRTSS